MYYNDMKNAKAKYETLFDVHLTNKVEYEDYDNLVSVMLEEVLMDTKVNETNLFLAAE